MKLARVVLAVVLTAAACASAPPLEQRTTVGPIAEEIWMYRVFADNGREPTFDERLVWMRQLDLAIGRYLATDQEFANSPMVSTFRSNHQPAVGMSKEQVTILFGRAPQTTTDKAEMAKLAGRYWPQIEPNATEAWVYPLGWRFYFSGDRLVDITQYLPR